MPPQTTQESQWSKFFAGWRRGTMSQLAKSTVLSVAAVTIATGATAVLLAQNCGDLPPRAESGQHRLAVRLSGTWEFFAPDRPGTMASISVAGAQTLCLAWEAPRYPGRRKQIVYVSTRYRDDQPIWLWRSSAFQIPIIANLLGDWNRTLDALGHDPDETFTKFHRSLPENANVAPWRSLVAWHETSVWFPSGSPPHSFSSWEPAFSIPTPSPGVFGS